MASSDYSGWFSKIAGVSAPHHWQSELAADAEPKNSLVRVPTGFGKTAGAILAWLYHRSERDDDRWPRRLVYCLPMRVLVEQTAANCREWLSRADLLWDGLPAHRSGRVSVHLLMGGTDTSSWALDPEHCAVLVGTQDMLLSRALNRGYGAPRARWPMEFGLLNQDCLWVMDEVQLMDVGLATSAQLQAFREQDRPKALRPCLTWWMSATLQRNWLTSMDTAGLTASLPVTAIAREHRRGKLWEGISKPCRIEGAGVDPKSLAELAAKEHLAQPHKPGRVTLVVVNTVERATETYKALGKVKALAQAGVHDLRLVHSRFRPVDRRAWREAFLNREAAAGADRIIVATQVVEAGVDMSATALITDLAPWASLVQRFGRAARYGGRANVTVVDLPTDKEKNALPYECPDLDAARSALRLCPDVSVAGLEAFEDAHPELVSSLYRYAPSHLLLRHEVDELFDTTPDLTGADLDISRFIRSGDERDVQVFWSTLPSGQPSADLQPTREELCAVPFLGARDWLKRGPAGKTPKGPWMWVWHYLDGRWTPARERDLVPGRVVLVDSRAGGYTPETGWAPRSDQPVAPGTQAIPIAVDTAADEAQDSELLSVHPWKTIATHASEVETASRSLAAALIRTPRIEAVIALAARWHDVGKTHPAFQGSMRAASRPARDDLAKGPDLAWSASWRYRTADDTEYRPAFRHELASVLSMFDVLRRHDPQHGALCGPWGEAFVAIGAVPPSPRSTAPPTPTEQDVLTLAPQDFDLAAYLVASHHGKLRVGWHAAPADQDYHDHDGRGMPLRGVREGDELPSVTMPDARGDLQVVPAAELVLDPAAIGLSPRTGPSWMDRVASLLDRHGPFALAWLEALLRVADIRASALDTADSLLSEEGRP